MAMTRHRVGIGGHLSAEAVAAHESEFPLFLLAVLAPLVALPFATVEGHGLARYGLPLAVDLLVVQSLRAMPPWQGRLVQLPVQGLYKLLAWLGAVSVWLPYLQGHQLPNGLRVMVVLCRALFYVMTAVRIIQVLANSHRVNSRLLGLGAAGYVHLGLTGGQLATLMQLIDSDSFRLGAMGGGEELLTRLSYFAFVTIGTLGYGDVVPASPVGESFVVLLSISSTLYVSLLIGLLLSRYINFRTTQSMVEHQEIVRK
jgi:hypothetical protein